LFTFVVNTDDKEELADDPRTSDVATKDAVVDVAFEILGTATNADMVVDCVLDVELIVPLGETVVCFVADAVFGSTVVVAVIG
jgi:hypothetical protein